MNEKEEKRLKAKKLIELAVDDPGSEEGKLAAMRACKIIRKYRLLDVTPLDGVLEHEGFRAAKAVADVVTDPEFSNNLKTLGGMFKEQISRASRRRR